MRYSDANLQEVNAHDQNLESVIVDLPNYIFGHSTKFQPESELSKDW